MKRQIRKCFALVIVLLILFTNVVNATEINITNTTNGKYHNPEAIRVPETNINLKIENLTRGAKVYLLLSENMIRHNMQKFVDNNLENPYVVEAKEAAKIKSFLDKSDYLGYIEYFREAGFEVENNEIELRHYCFCLGNANVIGYMNYNKVQYVQIEINLNDSNEFKLILKDYLANYDSRDTKFMIDEYGSKTYIELENVPLTQNPEASNITDCNVKHEYTNKEDYESIENSIKITYLIIYIILIIIALIILITLIKRHIKKKEEIEARKFWKKKLTKEEKKEEKKRLKEERKESKKNKKKKKK